MLSPSASNTEQSTMSIGYGDYLRFSNLLYDRCGLYFSESRRVELERGIRQAFAASTCTNLNEYFQLMQDHQDGALSLELLINAVTVGETHFFRDAAQMDGLFRHVLPEIIQRRRSIRSLRIWSAGCASGEEPYSIAMLLHELLPDIDEWSITILGTDINTEALVRARKAVYGEWAFREEQAKEWRVRYFHKHDNRYELSPVIKNMVTFSRFNLVEDVFPSYQTNTMFMDLILCRNVMIYFSEEITKRIVEKFYDALIDGGWLVVGHAEHSLVTFRRFQAHNLTNAILYQRAGETTSVPYDWESFIIPPKEKVRTTKKVEHPPQIPIPVNLPTTSQQLPDLSIHTPPSDAISTPDLSLKKLKNGKPIETAEELIEYGHSDQARDLLLEVIDAVQPQPKVYELLGQAHANLGEWENAEQRCRNAIQMDKLALEAYYTLSLIMQHIGQMDQALEMMKKVVYINRNHILGHYGLANLYHSNHQLAQALKSLDNALRLLDKAEPQTPIPGSGGTTVERLRQSIIQQQQHWSAEVLEAQKELPK
jgi:chemotaxis protein methyltransferase CheR